jgi:hypothetical protein
MPDAIPVTIPELPILAIVGIVLLQTPPATESPRVIVWPWQTPAGPVIGEVG